VAGVRLYVKPNLGLDGRILKEVQNETFNNSEVSSDHPIGFLSVQYSNQCLLYWGSRGGIMV